MVSFERVPLSILAKDELSISDRSKIMAKVTDLDMKVKGH